MEREDIGKLVSYEEIKQVNNSLEKIYKELSKQTEDLEKPSGLADRVFVDLFGFAAMYLLLFFTCDITRSIITNDEMFGVKWLFWGPYYFFTSAPILTRVWKSKKFLEDLAEVKSQGLEYDPQKTCSLEGGIYQEACEREEDHPHNHPVRDHLGRGLDWMLRHTIGKHLGGVLGNATCQDQGITIAMDCADQRLTRAYNCYAFFCEQHGCSHIADINWPNTEGSFGAQTNHWDARSVSAYQLYYDIFHALYLTGSTAMGSDTRPTNLNPQFDYTNNYCFNANILFQIPITNDTGFGQPNWWRTDRGWEQDVCYYQNNYTSHLLDYWD
jgi:hypothetical protein